MFKCAGYFTVEVHIVDDSFSLGCLNEIQAEHFAFVKICTRKKSLTQQFEEISIHKTTKNKLKKIHENQNMQKLNHVRLFF